MACGVVPRHEQRKDGTERITYSAAFRWHPVYRARPPITVQFPERETEEDSKEDARVFIERFEAGESLAGLRAFVKRL